MFRRFMQDDSGATAIEYGLIIAVLSLAIVTGVSRYATQLGFLFGNDSSAVQKALR